MTGATSVLSSIMFMPAYMPVPSPKSDMLVNTMLSAGTKKSVKDTTSDRACCKARKAASVALK